MLHPLFPQAHRWLTRSWVALLRWCACGRNILLLRGACQPHKNGVAQARTAARGRRPDRLLPGGGGVDRLGSAGRRVFLPARQALLFFLSNLQDFTSFSIFCVYYSISTKYVKHFAETPVFSSHFACFSRLRFS